MTNLFPKKPNSRAVSEEPVNYMPPNLDSNGSRVEDLEDLRDLQAAIAENGSEPLIPWKKAKAELEID